MWHPTKLEKLKSQSDSLQRLGYGVTTYRDTIVHLIVIFVLISILATPQILGYYNGGGYG